MLLQQTTIKFFLTTEPATRSSHVHQHFQGLYPCAPLNWLLKRGEPLTVPDSLYC